MRIVSWNCNRSLGKKLCRVGELEPDLLIVQESENPEMQPTAFQGYCSLWEKSDKKDGIGIFTPRPGVLTRLEWSGTFAMKGISNGSPALSWSTQDLHQFIPFTFKSELTVLAVWTKEANSASFGYIGQFWKFLQIHKNDLPRSRTIIVGDFNSNAIWDRPDRWWNHSDVERELASLGFQSLYHVSRNEKPGRESMPTLYHRKDPIKRYHIDYAFVSEDLIPRTSLQIGDRDDWISLSDHMPLIIDIDV